MSITFEFFPNNYSSSPSAPPDYPYTAEELVEAFEELNDREKKSS